MSKTDLNLEQLNKEALIELAKLLPGRVSTLERRVEQLTGQAKEEKKVKKTPENSSIPSGQAQKGNIEKKAKAKCTLTRFMQSYSRQMGRGRLTREAKVRMDRQCRGFLLSTGETKLEGEMSVTARMFNLEIPPWEHHGTW